LDIEQFMRGYKAARERRDESLFCSLFASDGAYHNTPFAIQRGHAQLSEYWRRVKLQEDVRVDYEVLASTSSGRITFALAWPQQTWKLQTEISQAHIPST
jgi:hypothetical protein